jgi:hypothetical protein
MKVDEQANLDRIHDQKSKSDVTNPLEPLIINLLKGFLDDADLSAKLQRLFRVISPPPGVHQHHSTCHPSHQ